MSSSDRKLLANDALPGEGFLGQRSIRLGGP